jgi:hypothetical protein
LTGFCFFNKHIPLSDRATQVWCAHFCADRGKYK